MCNNRINIGSDKEVTILQLAELVKTIVVYRITIEWDATKTDATLSKLTDVSRLHYFGWHHKMELEDGASAICCWY